MANDPKTVKTPPGIASYAFVFQPRPSMNPGGEPQFSITLIFPKGTDLSGMKAAARAAVADKWGDKPPANLRSPFRDGNTDRADDPTYADTTFVSAKSSTRPGIVDNALRPIIDPMEFYSGCRCWATLYAFAYDVNGNRGVTFLLNNLQKLGDGERLSGRRPAEADFEPVPGEAAATDPTNAAGNALFD